MNTTKIQVVPPYPFPTARPPSMQPKETKSVKAITPTLTPVKEVPPIKAVPPIEYSLSLKLPPPSTVPIPSKECGPNGPIPLMVLGPGIRKEVRGPVVTERTIDTGIETVSLVETIKDEVARDLVVSADEEVAYIRKLLGELMVDVKKGQISMKKMYDIDVAGSKVHNLLSEAIKLLS